VSATDEMQTDGAVKAEGNDTHNTDVEPTRQESKTEHAEPAAAKARAASHKKKAPAAAVKPKE
jgi:hypothetical protein